MSSIGYFVIPMLIVALNPIAFGGSISNTNDFLTNAPVKTLQKLAGGTAATDGQIPYQVQLQINTASTSSLCGGTLVSSSVVVTAAQCFYGLTVTSITVYAGSAASSGSSSHAQTSQMASYWTHPNFLASNLYNNIAVVTLATPFTLNSYVAIMPIAASSATFADGTSCTVSGWGSTSGGSALSTLLYASVSTVSQSTCALTTYRMPNTVFCTTTGTTGSCVGDSGGPLVCRGTARDGTTTNVLAGIISYSVYNGCATGSSTPAINTYVSLYSDTIYDFILNSTSNTPIATSTAITSTGTTLSSTSTTGFPIWAIVVVVVVGCAVGVLLVAGVTVVIIVIIIKVNSQPHGIASIVQPAKTDIPPAPVAKQ